MIQRVEKEIEEFERTKTLLTEANAQHSLEAKNRQEMQAKKSIITSQLEEISVSIQARFNAEFYGKKY